MITTSKAIRSRSAPENGQKELRIASSRPAIAERATATPMAAL